MLYYSHGVVLLLLIFNLQSYADDKGHLVIIGGGERAAVILNKISELAGGPDGEIVIIPVANSNPLEIALLQRYEFEETGIGEAKFVFLDNPGSADADSILEFLDNASGIFFSGGSQRRLAKALNGTKLLQRIHEIYKQGGVIAGTSAGAAVMSRMMITGG
jgi:cyanophycinase